MIVFEPVNGNDIWQEKKMFKHLIEHREEVEEELSRMKVTRVIAFDTLGFEFDSWTSQDQMTLVIMPFNSNMNLTGKRTRERLKEDGFTVKENYYPVDISSHEIVTDSRYLIYYKTRNLIVSRVNLFADSKLFSDVINKFWCVTNETQVKVLNPEQILELRLSEQWYMNINNKVDELKSTIKGLNEDIYDLTRGITQKSRELFMSQQTLENIQNVKDNFTEYLHRNIEEMSKFPFIKSFEVKDRIYLSFGPVYITGLVQTGVSHEGGTEQPIMAPKKVYIGDLKFVITGTDIHVSNPDNEIDGEYQHPHIKDGKICFGDVSGEAKKLLANIELAKLAKLLYSVAVSYNESSPYCKLQRFYDIQKKKEGENDD